MEYHRDRFTDLSLLVEDGTKLVACVPLNREGDEAVSHGGLTFGGVVSRRDTSTRTMLDVFDVLLGSLREAGCTALTYKPAPHIYHRGPAEEDLYALFRNGARLVRRDVCSVVDLAHRLPYDRGRRGSLNRSARNGLTLATENDVRPYIALLSSLLEAKGSGGPVHTAEELQRLADRFPQEIRLHTARRDGELLAGVVVYATPLVARAQYIGATDEGKRLGALDAIIDRLLGEVHGDKRWFDLGTSMDPATGELDRPLVRNKESYGASAVAFDRYVVDLT